MNAQMNVSKHAVRTESVINGRTVVEIFYPQQQKRILYWPDVKQFVEQKISQQTIPTGEARKNFSPCADRVNSRCRKLDVEIIAGLKAEKWEMVRTVDSQNLRSLHWIEVERKFPIRELFPDGTVAEMSMAGKGKIDGRDVERWEMRATQPGGKQLQSVQWYDPELRIAIREEFEGGFVRELRNIKVGKQSPTLFVVPDDFTRASNPPGSRENSQFNR